MRKSKSPRLSPTEELTQSKRKKRFSQKPQGRGGQVSEAEVANTAKSPSGRSKVAPVKSGSPSVENAKNFYLGEQAVAERWGVSVKYVQSLRYKGQGPRFTVFGRNVRYHIRELKAFEKANSFANRAEVTLRKASFGRDK